MMIYRLILETSNDNLGVVVGHYKTKAQALKKLNGLTLEFAGVSTVNKIYKHTKEFISFHTDVQSTDLYIDKVKLE